MKLFQQTGIALSADVILTVILPDSAESGTVFAALWSQINLFEQKFSRFLPESELTKLNHFAGESVRISSGFGQLLQAAKDMSQKSDGIFNPFILPALCQAGYCQSWTDSDTPSDKIDYANLQQFTKYDQIKIGKGWAKIPVKTAIDLGGIGKGCLLDQLAQYLENQAINNYWLSLGGDILCNGTDIDKSSWSIDISDALRPEKTVDLISNDGKKLAIATSGITKRKGFSDGRAWHHLIDPTSSQPAVTDILTATVCAKTATLADITAKCFVIIGSGNAQKILDLLSPQKVCLQLEPVSSDKSKVRIIKYQEGK